MSSGFSAFVKMDDGLINQAIKNLGVIADKLPRGTYAKAAKRSFIYVRNSAKTKASVRTGALRNSLGVRVKTFKRTGVVYAVVGPKTDYMISSARANREGVTKINYRKNRKGQIKVKPMAGYTIRPTKYAHLLEFGHKDRAGGRVQGKPFMQAALSAIGIDRIVRMFAEEVELGVKGFNEKTGALRVPTPKEDEVI